MKVAAYQAPLASCGTDEALAVVRTQIKHCESLGLEILCCPEGMVGGLADYLERPADIAIDLESGGFHRSAKGTGGRQPSYKRQNAMVRTERQKMLDGELYDPLDPELVAARVHARDLCQALNATSETQQDERQRILREIFATGGDTVWMQPPFFCDYGSNIELGERVFFNFNCVVLDVCRVSIGSFSLFGPAVQIYTPMHPMNAEQRRVQEFGKPVEIGSDVWVGGGAIILPGVRIGSRAVIGAGSVVTRDIPENVFAAGNPCRVIREIID